MKRIIVALLATMANFAVVATAQPELPVPSRAQAEWLNAGIGIFVHWAPNVYQGTEGDNLSTPRGKINPERFDASKIVQAAKSANAGYLIFVAKHVGGYCAWQTTTTDYSIKTSPWKGGQGDMVGDLAKACREQGLRFGVYLSPRSDFNQVAGGDTQLRRRSSQNMTKSTVSNLRKSSRDMVRCSRCGLTAVISCQSMI